MAIFSDIELDWGGVTYRLRGDRNIMRAIAAVEDHITLTELFEGQERGSIPFAKLSGAFTEMLHAAGCRSVTSAEVYQALWSSGDGPERIGVAVSALLQVMLPPGALKSAANASDEETDDNDQQQDAKKKPAKNPVVKTSRKRT
jgi:hypothetical protein